MLLMQSEEKCLSDKLFSKVLYRVVKAYSLWNFVEELGKSSFIQQISTGSHPRRDGASEIMNRTVQSN